MVVVAYRSGVGKPTPGAKDLVAQVNSLIVLLCAAVKCLQEAPKQARTGMANPNDLVGLEKKMPSSKSRQGHGTRLSRRRQSVVIESKTSQRTADQLGRPIYKLDVFRPAWAIPTECNTKHSEVAKEALRSTVLTVIPCPQYEHC
ncbi:hypothetical protein TNCV_5090671 [Trichonephila clavipes]|nr:hypothetical protein TNCV_5090671 [Trichonephila clavipes]